VDVPTSCDDSVSTEYRQATSALKASERRYRALFEGVSEIVYGLASDGTFNLLNPFFERVTGWSVGEWVGRPFADLVHPDDRDAAFESWAHLTRGETIEYPELRLLTKTGAPLVVEITAATRIDEAGTTSIIGFAHDVTERKAAQTALEDERRLLRMVLNNLPDAVYLKDLETRKLLANRADLDNIGVADEAEVLGKTDLEVFPEDVAARFYAHDRAVLDRGEPLFGVEDCIVGHDGQERWIVTSKLPVRDASGNVIGLLGIGHDITRRKQHEEQLRQRLAELEMLHRLSRQLFAAGLDPDGTYIAVHHAVAAVMPCDAFVITLADDAEEGHHGVYLVDRDGRWPAKRFPRGVGLSGYVIACGETVLIDDLDANHDHAFSTSYFGREVAVRSILAVPFRRDDRVVGMISAQSYEPAAYTSHHRLLMETLAVQFSAAIQNAHLYQQLQARLHETETLAAVSAALRTASTRADMPAVILQQLVELLEVDGATFEVVDPGTGGVIIELGWGTWSGATGMTIPPGEGLSPTVLASGKPYLSNTAQDDPRLFRPDLFGKARTVAAAPMITEGDRVGLLWIASDRTLTEHVLGLLTAIADMAANAIRRATLHEQVEAQARRVQQIVDTVPEGVVLLDSHGHVLLANPAARRHLSVLSGGRTPVTHLGERPLVTFLTPREDLRHEVTAEGRTYEIVAQPIDEASETTLWVVVIDDVTHERQARLQQQRQERLAAVGQLAAGMAHDFNNILAVIVLYAHMAQRSLEPSHPVQRWMSVISDQSGQATDLIQQMLDFSRQGDVQRHPLDLYGLLTQQVRLLQRTLPESIEVTFDAAPSATYVVLADATRIQQIITNLALNARDAMPQGGRLCFGLAPQVVAEGKPPPIREMEPGVWIRLTVEDTGTGMEPEVRGHLFEPFFTTKEPGKGTGLGLAQVYGIVGQHEGFIDVDTEPGRGTTFSIYLRAFSETADSPPEAGPVEVSQGVGQTVLVVEDNEVLRGALVATLGDLGYAALEAADGEAALSLVETRGSEVALVLSDVVMPKMGGVALLRTLRTRGWDGPVILLTGHSLDQEPVDVWEWGLSAWLHKPPLPGELAEALAAALPGHRGGVVAS